MFSKDTRPPVDYAPHLPDAPIDFDNRKCHPLYWQPGVIVLRPDSLSSSGYSFDWKPGENDEWIEQFNRDVVQVAARIPLSDLRPEDFTLAWLLITQQLVPRPDFQQKLSLERFQAYMNEVRITEAIVHAVLNTVASLVGAGDALGAIEKTFGGDAATIEAGNKRFETAFTQALIGAGREASTVPVAIARYLTHADDVAVFNGEPGEFVFDQGGGLLGGGHWEGRSYGWPPGTVNVDQSPNPYKVQSLAGAIFQAAMPGTFRWEGDKIVNRSAHGTRARRYTIAFVPRGRLFLARVDQNPETGEAVAKSPWDLPWWNTTMVNPRSLKFTAITFARVYRALDVMACGYAQFKPSVYNWLNVTTTGKLDPNVPPLFFYRSKLGPMIGSIFPPIKGEDIDLSPPTTYDEVRGITAGEIYEKPTATAAAPAPALAPTPAPPEPEFGLAPVSDPTPTASAVSVSRLLATWNP